MRGVVSVILTLAYIVTEVDAVCVGNCFYISWWFWAAISFSAFIAVFFVILCYQKKYRKRNRQVGFGTTTVIATSRNGCPTSLCVTSSYKQGFAQPVYPVSTGYGDMSQYNFNQPGYSHNLARNPPFPDPGYPPPNYPPPYPATTQTVPSAPYDSYPAHVATN